MKDKVHEIPEHLRQYIKHAQHPDGRVERFGVDQAAHSSNNPDNKNGVKQYINSIKRGKGLPVIE